MGGPDSFHLEVLDSVQWHLPHAFVETGPNDESSYPIIAVQIGRCFGAVHNDFDFGDKVAGQCVPDRWQHTDSHDWCDRNQCCDPVVRRLRDRGAGDPVTKAVGDDTDGSVSIGITLNRFRQSVDAGLDIAKQNPVPPILCVFAVSA